MSIAGAGGESSGNRDFGLEQLAEDGNAGAPALPGDAGAASVGRDASGAGPIVPPHGDFSFTISASAGDMLSLATMFGQSNDWSFAMQDQPLFDVNGRPISGNFTHEVGLCDAGTEVDEPVGYGPNQAARQAVANAGLSEGGVVTRVTMAPYADAMRSIHVAITPIYY